VKSKTKPTRTGRSKTSGPVRSKAGKPGPSRPSSSPSGPGLRVRPLRDRVLVRRVEPTPEKGRGIVLPDTAKEKPQQAEVIAVGSGRLLENGQKAPLTLKVGDKVLIGKWSGTEVKINDNEYLILKEDEVLGILS